MENLPDTLALHTNHLTFANLPEVRRAIEWFSRHVRPINNIHLLQLRPRIPAHAMYLSSAESIYHSEYQEGHEQLETWRNLLAMPQCTTWFHEGSQRLELRSLCQKHHFTYLLTTKKIADQLDHGVACWHRGHTRIVQSFNQLALVAMETKKEQVPTPLPELKLASNYI